MLAEPFQAALRKLVNDEQYREQVKNDPQRIVNDFQFTDADLGMLAAVGRADGSEGSAEVRVAGHCCSCGGCCCTIPFPHPGSAPHLSQNAGTDDVG